MKEIKFRGWDKNEGKWHYFNLFNVKMYIEIFQKHLNNGDEFYLFTGLLDKNGKEIWEGDIVKYYRFPIYRDEISDVKYLNPQHLETESGFWPFINFNGGLVNTSSIEVIGNIYENPELLEDKG